MKTVIETRDLVRKFGEIGAVDGIDLAQKRERGFPEPRLAAGGARRQRGGSAARRRRSAAAF